MGRKKQPTEWMLVTRREESGRVWLYQPMTWKEYRHLSKMGWRIIK